MIVVIVVIVDRDNVWARITTIKDMTTTELMAGFSEEEIDVVIFYTNNPTIHMYRTVANNLSKKG